MQDLFLQHDLADATHVLLTGDSAGGVGAMNNADWIGSMLRYVSCPQSASCMALVAVTALDALIGQPAGGVPGSINAGRACSSFAELLSVAGIAPHI